MAARLSPRLAALVDALPLRPDARVLEVGCGPGAAARAVADRLTTGQVLAVEPGEQPYDLVLAFRVGALDGRHPELGVRVLAALRAVTTPDARLLVDGGDPLRELPL